MGCRACFGVTGPAASGQAKNTNFSWIMFDRQSAASLGLSRLHLMNDFMARRAAD
jgi:glucokinase